jgi:sialic acid synthase SpsE
MQKMIEEAARIGVDYIKFQLFDADNLNENWENYKTAYSNYKKYQLSNLGIKFILKHSENCGILPLFTAFRLEQAKRLKVFGCDRVKIASPDCNNWDLIDYCVKNFKDVFVSTGMHHGYEIHKILKEYGEYIIPMFCRSIYPVKEYTKSDYAAMEYLKAFGSWAEWGLSDHSESVGNAYQVLVRLSPNYIERHFTLEKTGKKDDCVSSTPDEMLKLTNFPFPDLSEEEIKNRKYITRWTNE